jgi:hypothetical protein
MRRRRRWPVVVLAGLVLATAVAFGLNSLLEHVSPAAPTCALGTGTTSIDYDPEQAADAATIAAVAKRQGLVNHAVTIALATALQESKLYNVDYGDRDSLGLFQQRPSQGWGTPTQLLDPAYAASAFFQHLAQVPGWQTLDVAAAAQRVQHSADGSAYAQWEEQARALARALTGEVAAGLACKWPGHRAPQASELSRAADRELGPGWQSATGASRHWTAAEWLVAHSYQYGVAAVAVEGHRWTARTGKWVRDSRAVGPPSFVLDSVRKS